MRGILDRFDFSIRFLSAHSKRSISRGKISVPGLAASYLGRSLFYLRPQARLARVSTMSRRSASSRMHSVTREKRNIGKWFWKVRLRRSGATPDVIRNEIAWNRRDEYLVSRLRIRRLIGISAFQWESIQFFYHIPGRMLKSNTLLRHIIHRYARKLINHIRSLSKTDSLLIT